MQSIKPRTYNELMRYRRCLELQRTVPQIDSTLFEQIYQHICASGSNSIGVTDGILTFYQGGEAVQSIAVAVSTAYTAIRLSSTALDIQRPFSGFDSLDSGNSGNNNNNNNNNNNG